DIAKKVSISYIIFLSLYHVTEATKGRLSYIPYFNSKANIKKYIRAFKLKSTFILPRYY
ncbi:hypothetical protein DL95DRAFT_278952, partial [Leptodontidium sp. 2 PMI_412]